jgi:hypothetical protein
MHLHGLPSPSSIPSLALNGASSVPTSGDAFDRDTCLSETHSAASIIKTWIKHIKADDAKIQDDLANGQAMGMSSRNRNGIGGPYVLVPWFWTAERLIKGGKVLRDLGRMDGELRIGLALQHATYDIQHTTYNIQHEWTNCNREWVKGGTLIWQKRRILQRTQRSL